MVYFSCIGIILLDINRLIKIPHIWIYLLETYYFTMYLLLLILILKFTKIKSLPLGQYRIRS